MNIIIFGPNGSGKGTQGTLIQKEKGIAHIESGVIFRWHKEQHTDLGREAQKYMDEGHLVPDSLTIPMVLERLRLDDCKNGWILDGFPRTPAQAQSLLDSGARIDLVLEIVLDRKSAKGRIMGRRICENDGNHPNNVNIPALRPDGDRCRVCGGALGTRADDQDEAAIDRRHGIYYDNVEGTLAAAYVYRDLARTHPGTMKYVAVDGSGALEEVKALVMAAL